MISADAIRGYIDLIVLSLLKRQPSYAYDLAKTITEVTAGEYAIKQTTLYSTIENYWLQANNNQRMFRSAQVSSLSAKESYTLLSEQFRLGLKNIVELMTGKDNLLKARQNELQSKYLAILNINLLKFYQNGVLK